MIVIPGGCTPYLQAGDIGVFCELKDKLGEILEAWEKSNEVCYTKKGNPKPPDPLIIEGWLRDLWRGISVENIKKSLKAAGFSDDYKDWHISKHDLYSEKFC